MADDQEKPAQRARKEEDPEEDPEESEEESDDDEDEDIIIDGEKFNADDLIEPSDDDEEESEGDEGESDDDEGDEVSSNVAVGGDIYVVIHQQENKLTAMFPPPKLDCEIVAVVSSLDKAMEIATTYVESTFELDDTQLRELEDFDEWFADGWEDEDDQDESIIHRVTIEVHDLK